MKDEFGYEGIGGGDVCCCFHEEDGVRVVERSRGLGDAYERQIALLSWSTFLVGIFPSKTKKSIQESGQRAHLLVEI